MADLARVLKHECPDCGAALAVTGWTIAPEERPNYSTTGWLRGFDAPRFFDIEAFAECPNAHKFVCEGTSSRVDIDTAVPLDVRMTKVRRA